MVNGILLLNKPQGISSNAALQKVKALLAVKKAGHTGSLDPLATGMLPICLGEATKLCQFLLDADKCYLTTGTLGIKTDSGDVTGVVQKTVDNIEIDEKTLLKVIEGFKGPIQQVPSMFSALKYKGQPLYKYARDGKIIERSPRDIYIRQLELKSFNNTEMTLLVRCSKGTYIRNLVEDIGEALNGVGAHVRILHRCYIEGFEQQPMYSIEELQQLNIQERIKRVLPMDFAVTHLPSIQLNSEESLAIRHGKFIDNPGTQPIAHQWVRLYNKDNLFLGLGEKTTYGQLKAKRLLSNESIFVS